MKQKIPKHPIKFGLYTLSGHRKFLVLTIFGVFLTELMGLALPVILGKLVDTANAYAFEESVALSAVLFFVILYPIILLFEFLAIRGTNMSMHYLTAYMRTNAYKILYNYLSGHSSAYFNNRFAGSLAGDVNILGGNIVRLANFIVRNFFGLFVGLIISFFIIATASMMLSLVFIGGILLLVPINYFLAKPIAKYSAEAARTSSVLRGQIVDSITNIVAVHHFARRREEAHRLDESIYAHRDADIKSDVFLEKVILLNNILVAFFMGGIIIAAFWLWSQEIITIGQFVLITALIVTLARSLTWIGFSINEFASIYGEAKSRLHEILVPHDVVDASDAKELIVGKPNIVFEDVSFLYEQTTEVFDGFSLSISAGEKVGIVGHSGGGKSTLVKLLLRQYDLNDGVITIGGQDISKVTQESLRMAVGIVPQEPMLFHRSLAENIKYGKPEAPDEEMIRAAELAQAHEFIKVLPDGYDTLVGERGVKLSAGQRQRVAIARAILKDAPILVLDEATSALDSESEVAIQQALHVLMEGKTVIAVAHRLSTLREMDRILVMEQGRNIQDGSHDELLAQDGLYKTLWEHQAGGFLRE